MSAQDHLAPKQLAMFMPAKTLLKTHDLGDAEDYGRSAASRKALMAEKSDENDFFGAPDPAAPVVVFHNEAPLRPLLMDGHHRLAAALPGNREMPVQHVDEKNWWTT